MNTTVRMRVQMRNVHVRQEVEVQWYRYTLFPLHYITLSPIFHLRRPGR